MNQFCKLFVFFVFVFLIFSCVSAKSENPEISNPSGLVRHISPSKDVLAKVSIPATLTALDIPVRADLLREFEEIDMSDFKDGVSHSRFGYEDGSIPYPLYNPKQIAGIAENMLSWQCKDGGWSKNLDYYLIQTDEQWCDPVYQGSARQGSTFDNTNIYPQVEYLSRVYKQIPDERYKNAVIRAIEYMLKKQNPVSGGYRGADVDAVTFNDNVMTGIMNCLHEVATDDDLYGYLPKELREKTTAASEKILRCILDCQVKVTLKDGTTILTAWGQQHDHKTLKPVWARNYEPPCITASESCGVVRGLMKIENPSDEVKNAILSACAWMDREDVKIHGWELVRKPIPMQQIGGRKYDFDQLLVENKDAKPIWARFYDPETMEPLWYDRGKKKCDWYNDIGIERRNGYRFVYYWPEKLLSEDLPAWKEKHGIQ